MSNKEIYIRTQILLDELSLKVGKRKALKMYKKLQQRAYAQTRPNSEYIINGLQLLIQGNNEHTNI